MPGDWLKLEYPWLLVAETPLEIRSDPDEILCFFPLSFILFVVVLTFAEDDPLCQV